MTGILETLDEKLNLILAKLERLSGDPAAAPEVLTPPAAPAPKKPRKTKSETEDTPELPNGLVITAVDVAPPPVDYRETPAASASAVQAEAAEQPVAISNDTVVLSIGALLDSVAPQGTPNRASLTEFSSEYMAANGLTRATLNSTHIKPLVDYCKARLAEKLQAPQQVGGL